VQIQIHHAQTRGIIHNFPTMQGVMTQVIPLVTV
jgi:hypothetical protein